MSITGLTRKDIMDVDDTLYRDVFDSGRDFINKYLVKYSSLETDNDFELRKRTTYCPSHAKSALIEVRNSIYQRMVDITRKGGPENYVEAVRGENGGVDLAGHSMNDYIGSFILEELLILGKVGVFIDKMPLKGSTKAENTGLRPYIYYYRKEDILNWAYDNQHRLVKVLLRDQIPIMKEGFETDTKEVYRLLEVTPEGVHVKVSDDSEIIYEDILNLTRIPFIIGDIGSSLLRDIAHHQIALLNLASSDVNYLLRANYPFYVEQYAPGAEMFQGESDGTEAGSKAPVITTGPTRGRRYAKGMDQPNFIHPSSEPITASMVKQKSMKEEIRELVQLALENLAKDSGNQGLEAGLSYIGQELRHIEQCILEIWCEYEGHEEDVTVSYPKNYSLLSDKDQREEAKELSELAPKVPSLRYQKEVAKRIAVLTLGTRITQEEVSEIEKEIEAAPVVVSDPEVILKDIEAGLVGVETASKARGYPEGEVEKAKQDHADRAARIALAQSTANQSGVADMNEPDSGKNDKKAIKQGKELDAGTPNRNPRQ